VQTTTLNRDPSEGRLAEPRASSARRALHLPRGRRGSGQPDPGGPALGQRRVEVGAEQPLADRRSDHPGDQLAEPTRRHRELSGRDVQLAQRERAGPQDHQQVPTGRRGGQVRQRLRQVEVHDAGAGPAHAPAAERMAELRRTDRA
jgi:hypothetical protein